MLRLNAALLALTLECSPALAIYVNRVVPVGGTLKGQFYTAINPDCSLQDYPNVRVVTPPGNCVLSFRKGKDFPNFAADNPRGACNRTRVPVIYVDYRPNRGFVGSDTFSVDVFFFVGSERTDTFKVTVK